MHKDKISLGVDKDLLRAKKKDLLSLLEDVNLLYSTARSFGNNVPAELHLIIDYVDSQLREEFKSGGAIPVKIADVIGKEKEYSLINTLWSVIKSNSVFEQYHNWLRFEDGSYEYDKELESVLNNEYETFLEGEKSIEVYNYTIELIKQFNAIWETIGQVDIMREKKQITSGFRFLTCANDFVLKPNINAIKEL